VLFVGTPTLAANPNHAEVRAAVHHDVSPALRDLPNLMPELDTRKHEHPVKHFPHAAASADVVHDPVHQTASIGAFAATPGANFDGTGVPNYGVDAVPPDTNMSVGATQIVQWVNEAFTVYDKASHSVLLGPRAGNSLWSGFGGGCQNNNDGDPIVLWDKAAQRWVFTQFSVSTTPYLQCVAVSTTADATGTYNRYSFSYGNLFNDYGKMGVWPDGYYIAYNMFNTNNSFAGGEVCAFDRAKMLAGQAATQQCFLISDGGLLPSDLDGATVPPAGSPNYIAGFGTNVLNIRKFHVDWTNPGNTTLSAATALPVAAFAEACGGGACIPQSGSHVQLDSLADRLMFRLAYRNRGGTESLVVNHAVKVSGNKHSQITGVRWYEVRIAGTNPSLFQQGTFSPDSASRWMGSVAMDKVGDIAMGYSVSTSSTNPGIRFTGRVPTDPAGTMEAETTLFTGSGSQTTYNRWGDYSSISLDPSDDCTFWYTTEYLKQTGVFNWSTRIGSFKFPTCQ
jgi:hypothetical protein